jgi:hypothetical protein
MGCHVCSDEIFGFFAALAVFRYLPQWMRAAWAGRHQKPTCRHEHEHVHEITDDMIVACDGGFPDCTDDIRGWGGKQLCEKCFKTRRDIPKET